MPGICECIFQIWKGTDTDIVTHEKWTLEDYDVTVFGDQEAVLDDAGLVILEDILEGGEVRYGPVEEGGQYWVANRADGYGIRRLADWLVPGLPVFWAEHEIARGRAGEVGCVDNAEGATHGDLAAVVTDGNVLVDDDVRADVVPPGVSCEEFAGRDVVVAFVVFGEAGDFW